MQVSRRLNIATSSVHLSRTSLLIIWGLIKPYKWTMFAGIILILVSQLSQIVLPLSTKYMIDVVVANYESGKLLWLSGTVLVAITINALAYLSVSQLVTRAAEKLIDDLRRQLRDHVSHLSINYFDNNSTGILASRIMSDVEGLRSLVGEGMLNFVAASITCLITFYILIEKSRTLTVLLLAVQLLSGILLYAAFRFSRPIIRESHRLKAEIVGRLIESFGGVRTVKGYRAEDREGEVFVAGLRRLSENTLRASVGLSVIQSTGRLAVGLTSLFVMCLGGRLLMKGSWTIGDYVQYSSLLVYLVSPVFTIVNIGTQFTQAIAGLDRVCDVLDEKREDVDSSRIVVLRSIVGRLHFEEVTFAYRPGVPVLHRVSFVAEPGSVTALVGSSGSGKSTIISLLCAFQKPQSGLISVDGVDLSTITLDSYRAHLGLVLQDTFLFDGTIRENVLFSRPDASDFECLHACRAARIDEFAERFPSGYETIIGERGVKLSGGQRQRLSIARAILANPRILILDEATSSLDSESEAMIQEGLATLLQDRTTFVIAHRLSTIRKANQILVLEQGEIVERGSHDSLYMLGGRYYDLYRRQQGIESNIMITPTTSNEEDHDIKTESSSIEIGINVNMGASIQQIPAE